MVHSIAINGVVEETAGGTHTNRKKAIGNIAHILRKLIALFSHFMEVSSKI